MNLIVSSLILTFGMVIISNRILDLVATSVDRLCDRFDMFMDFVEDDLISQAEDL